MTDLTVGLSAEVNTVVTEQDTAARWGSGLVESLSTPAMIALMEGAAFNATRGALPPGQTTVGVHVNVSHLAATPVGRRVRARAELVNLQGRKLYFQVEAWDELEKIGEGTHERVVVDLGRFAKRLDVKRPLEDH